MKLGILSDLHLDHCGYSFFPEDYDVDLWLNAGDTGPALMRNYFNSMFPTSKYIWIHGNHDFYNEPIGNPDTYCKLINVGGLVIAAAPLWTDLTQGADWVLYKNGLIDYPYMKNAGWNERMYNLHHDYQKDFLLSSGADIIMSHHAPSFRSVNNRFKGDPYNTSFATELGYDILSLEKKPNLWIHGHMHDACDYMLGDVRVICHPRGYPRESNHKDYKPLILEI